MGKLKEQAIQRFVAQYGKENYPKLNNDIERVAESIQIEYGRAITDEETFDKAFNTYMKGNQGRSVIKEMVKAEYSERFTPLTIKNQQTTFRRAKGKYIVKDQKTTSKNIVTTVKEYKMRGASRTDLQGLDTKQSKKLAPSRIDGRIQFVQVSTFISKGRTVTRYRNNKGQFVTRK